MRNACSLLIGLLILSLCACQPTAVPTPRPTRALSAPPLQPTATIQILDSNALYAQETPNGANDPTSAALPSGQYQPPIVAGTADASGAQRVDLNLADGTLLPGELYEAATTSRVPGILLLGNDLMNWGALPVALRDSGYSVLVLALPIADYSLTDFDILLDTMSLITTIDPARVVVLGELGLADFALQGCAAYALCDALGMFSPLNREQGLVNASAFAPHPLLLVAAADDATSYPIALALAGITPTSSQFLEVGSGRGAGMVILEDALIPQIIAWLAQLWVV